MADSNKKRAAQEALANTSTSFNPKKKVTYTHGRVTLSMYPDIDNTMNDHERTLAFNINKNAVRTARSLDYETRLHIMGEKHNCSNLIDVELEHWKTTGFNQLTQNGQLNIITYHGYNGAVINDAFDQNGDLKPIQNGAMAACRPEGIVYAKVRATMDFTNLNNEDELLAHATFFLRLPVTDQQVLNAANNPRNLHTFSGPSDWLTIPQDQYYTLVYEHDEAIEQPFELLPPTFTDPQASPQIERKVTLITESIVKASYERILLKIFKQLCPNFLDDPFATLNKVRQETVDSNGVKIRHSVREYHEMIKTVITTFPIGPGATWNANPFRKFVEGLAQDIREKMESNNFTKHNTETNRLTPREQTELIQEAFQAACLAEAQLAKDSLRIYDALKEVHGFTTVAQNPPSGMISPLSSVSSHFGASPAEQTLNRYKQNPNQTVCWGCGSEDHQYYDKKTKTVTCPRGHEPEIQKRAEEVRQDFNKRSRERRRARSASRKRSQEESVSQLMTALTSKKPREAIKQLLIKDAKIKESHLGGTLVLPTFVLEAAQVSNKPSLPINVTKTLPHILLTLGASDGTFHPSIPVIVDTGAALNCAFTGYIMPIAKAYPHLVKSIIVAEDRYSPIILAGVVSSDNPDARNIMTNLPVIVEFHMPYLTEEGTPTSIKFAVGDNIGVNCLLGISFISAAKLVIDTNDNVVDSKLLDVSPFDITYRMPNRSAPNIVPTENQTSEKIMLIQQQIDHAIAFLAKHPGGDMNITYTDKPPTKKLKISDQLVEISDQGPLVVSPKKIHE